MKKDHFTCRKADISDLDELVRLRKIQLVDEGIEPCVNIDSELSDFFREALGNGSLIEWLLMEGSEIIATAAIMFYQFPPSYTNPSGLRGYVTNMYTQKQYRGRGMATRLLHKLADEARQAGVTKLWLGASTLGRPVYERFGFADTQTWLDLNLQDISLAAKS